MKTFREFLEIANIQLDEGIRNPDVPRRPLDQFLKAKEIMKNNAKEAERKGLGGELKDLAIQSVKDKMLDRFTNGQQPPESAESEEDMVEPTDGEGTALSKLLKIK